MAVGVAEEYCINCGKSLKEHDNTECKNYCPNTAETAVEAIAIPMEESEEET